MVIGLVKKLDFILFLWLTRTSHWAPRNFYFFFVEEQQFMAGKIKPFPNFSFGSNHQVGFSSPLFSGNKLIKEGSQMGFKDMPSFAGEAAKRTWPIFN